MTSERRRYDHAYQLRMPKVLFNRIKASAASKEHAVNSEIVAALAAAYPAPVEPESINEALLDASQAILADWSRTLEAIGQDPESNPRVVDLSAAIERARAGVR